MDRREKVLLPCTTSSAQLSEQLVGGKALNLSRLRDSGMSVPPWFVVSARVFEAAIAGHRSAITAQLASVDFGRRESVEMAAEKIRAIIEAVTLPRQIESGIIQLIGDSFASGTRLAVRSSVIGEDSSQHSFAGQMDSYLNVAPDRVIGAIKNVWASAFSPRALLYRHHVEISRVDVRTAVIVQQMVHSTAAGVLFTRDLERGNTDCVISAAYGFGEGAALDSVETDVYKISRDGYDVRADVVRKSRRVVSATGPQGGTRTASVPKAQRRQAVLSSPQIQRLLDTGATIEEAFGVPQDIEWAFDDSGALFILQSRPITQCQARQNRGSIRVWDNSNIVESYPGLTLPLTFSFAHAAYEAAFRNAAIGLTPLNRELRRRESLFRGMIGLLNGRVYYNLLNWYELLSLLPGFRTYQSAWEEMLGLRRRVGVKPKKISAIHRVAATLAVLRRLVFVESTSRLFFRHFNAAYQKFGNLDLERTTEDDIARIYEDLRSTVSQRWHLTLYNDFCAIRYFAWLKLLCQRWGLERRPDLHNELLHGTGTMESVAPVQSLLALVRQCDSEPRYRELLNDHESSTVWSIVQTDPEYAMLLTALESHLRKFGDRGIEELKLERPTFREDPALLIAMIQDHRHRGSTLPVPPSDTAKDAGEAELFVRRTLRNPLKRLVFWFFLRNARLAIANRENMRFARSRLYGFVRRLFRRVGVIFVERGLLASSDDVHYLTLDEVFALIHGTAVTQNVRALVELRKAEYAGYARSTSPSRIETEGVPYARANPGDDPIPQDTTRLQGIGCSSGIAEGTARVVLDPREHVGDGHDILIAQSTDPGWIFLMITAKGIVVERGSPLSHTAIIGRELGIPTVVGARGATRCVPNGARVKIDGGTGQVAWQS